MSRRESRDSDHRYHRSRFDREPSPKRVRRDGRPATERPAGNLNMASAEHTDRDQKHHRRLQDSLPLDASVVSDPKVETVPLSKESDKKTNEYREGAKNSSDNIEAPRSRSLFQHDERAGQVGRSFRRRETTERHWWKDSKDRQSGRATNRTSNNDDTKLRDERSHAQGADHRAWRHDDSYKMQPDSKPSLKKRPSFRETKIPADAGAGDKVATEATKTNRMEHPATVSERKEERGKPPEKPLVDRPDRRSTLERDPQRAELQRTKFQSRDRYGGGSGGGGGGGIGGSYGGRDRFNGRPAGQVGGRVEKWKHDLYDEANKSPTSKNEEDQIAKVEALLAS